MVFRLGFFVSKDTPAIKPAEIRVIGTTGRNPKIVVPPGVLTMTSNPSTDQIM